MKRDMDLAREILLQMEKAPYDGTWHFVAVEGHSPEEVTYHVMLLDQAGLIEAENLSSMDGAEWAPKTLTWAGHEFLDASRDNNRWENAKRILKDKGVDLTFDILKDVLTTLLKNAVFGAP